MKLKWRRWYNCPPPERIKLEVPGWAGLPEGLAENRPQPWHCPPFVDGATYGLELVYPFDTECTVENRDGKTVFCGDFSAEQSRCSEITFPPFMSFAPGHFGMTSALDVKVPSGYVIRTEPHPRYYTDETGTVPCLIPGHIQTEWWPKIFFVVFKNPFPGQKVVFRKGEPYGQILVVPRKVEYSIEEMTTSEINERCISDMKLGRYAKHFSTAWKDNLGHEFDDKYRRLSRIFLKSGVDGVREFLDSFSERASKVKFLGKFIPGKKR